MQLRQGTPLPRFRESSPVPVVMYIALQVWGIAVGFVLLAILICGFFFVFLYGPSRDWIVSNTLVLFLALISVEIGLRVVYYLLGFFVLVQHGEIKHHRWFMMFDSVYSLVTFVPGLLYSALRFVLIVLWTCILYVRMDIPTGVDEIHLDFGHTAYAAQVRVTYESQHPVVRVFVELMREGTTVHSNS